MNNKELFQDIYIERVFADASKEGCLASCLNELEVEVFINEIRSVIINCTNTYLEELIVGRLLSEKIISDIEEIEKIYICDSAVRARVFLKEGIDLAEETLRIASCCPDNQIYVKRVNEKRDKEIGSFSDINIEHETICKMINVSNDEMQLHKKTSGTHSCHLFYKDEMIFACEDIGRHNAMDKAIGYLYMNHLKPKECALFTTGRVPLDMIRKAVNAKIPILISKSVATAQAIASARENHVKLICKAWPDSYEIYS